jgi:hypothetical protein
MIKGTERGNEVARKRHRKEKEEKQGEGKKGE